MLKKDPNNPEIPTGLGIALAQNIDAMSHFASLPKEQQQAIIAHTHSIQSQQEMQEYVRSLLY